MAGLGRQYYKWLGMATAFNLKNKFQKPLDKLENL